MGKKDLKKQPNVSVCIYAIGLKQTCLNILVAVNVTNIQYNVKKCSLFTFLINTLVIFHIV